MKKPIRKLLTLILAMLTLLPVLAACKKDPEKPEQDSSRPTSGNEAFFEVSDSIKGLDLNEKEIKIWQFTKASNAAESFFYMNGDLKGGLVEQSIAKRNAAVEDYLNCIVTFTDTDVHSGNVGDHIRMQL